MDLHISQCKIETKITRCYLVECVIKNTNTYYKSELVFTNRNDAKALETKMKEQAKERQNESID